LVRRLIIEGKAATEPNSLSLEGVQFIGKCYSAISYEFELTGELAENLAH
jgi:hypothetical protein